MPESRCYHVSPAGKLTAAAGPAEALAAVRDGG